MLTLRDYQTEAIAAVAAAEARGVRRPLVALPTGTGKTVIFASLITQRSGRSLVLVRRDELIRQAERRPAADVRQYRQEAGERPGLVLVRTGTE